MCPVLADSSQVTQILTILLPLHPPPHFCSHSFISGHYRWCPWCVRTTTKRICLFPNHPIIHFACLQTLALHWAQDWSALFTLTVKVFRRSFPTSFSIGPATMPAWACCCGPNLPVPIFQAWPIPPPPSHLPPLSTRLPTTLPGWHRCTVSIDKRTHMVWAGIYLYFCLKIKLW